MMKIILQKMNFGCMEMLKYNIIFMKFSFEFTVDDYVTLIMYKRAASQTVKNTLNLMGVIILFFLLSNLPNIENGTFSVLYACVFLFSFFLLYLLRNKKNCEKVLRKQIKEGNFTSLFGMHYFEFFDDYFTIVTPGQEIKIFWKSIFKVVKEKDFIFLHITSFDTIIIPLDKTIEDRDCIISFIKKSCAFLDKKDFIFSL